MGDNNWTTVTNDKKRRKSKPKGRYKPPSYTEQRKKINYKTITKISELIKFSRKRTYLNLYLNDELFDQEGGSLLESVKFSLNKPDHRDLSRNYKKILTLLQELNEKPYYNSIKFLEEKLREFEDIINRIKIELSQEKWFKELEVNDVYNSSGKKLIFNNPIKYQNIEKNTTKTNSKVVDGKSFASLFT